MNTEQHEALVFHVNMFLLNLTEIASSIVAQYPEDVENEVLDYLQDQCNLMGLDILSEAKKWRELYKNETESQRA